MLFSSFQFIFVFLPIVWALYALSRRAGSARIAFAVLTVGSLVFYGYQDWRYLGLLIPSIGANYALGHVIAARVRAGGSARWVLALGVVLNLALIGVFKYADFVLGSLASIGGPAIGPLGIVLPLGISFFTFQQIAYLVDCSRDGASEQGVVPYAFFVSFFPQLIAGPIVHHKQVLPQLRDQLEGGRGGVLPADVVTGLTWFSFGLFKKVVLADTLSPWVAQAFDGEGAISVSGAWAGTLAYTLQIYFDFSGYSDMAIGLGLLFGLRLPLNFDSPYKATSVVDFWRRWHMTLSAFLRDYVYIPLGGNRLGPARRYVNLMATMLIGGLWHGASWTFVAWGGLHGLGLCIAHGAQRVRIRVPRAAGWVLTMALVVGSWILFRAESFEGAREMLAACVGLGAEAGDSRFDPGIAAWATIAVLLGFCVLAPNTQAFMTKRDHGPVSGVIAGVALVVALLFLRETLTSGGRLTEFIYFRF
ncbi:MAG: MBOAT family O-acyltransferase [Planctomycetota bacterium]